MSVVVGLYDAANRGDSCITPYLVPDDPPAIAPQISHKLADLIFTGIPENRVCKQDAISPVMNGLGLDGCEHIPGRYDAAALYQLILIHGVRHNIYICVSAVRPCECCQRTEH